MPEKEIKRRGGAIRWRTKRVNGYIHVAVVRKPGPRGGRTIAGPVHKHKTKKKRR
jgi:hypothetical protein